MSHVRISTTGQKLLFIIQLFLWSWRGTGTAQAPVGRHRHRYFNTGTNRHRAGTSIEFLSIDSSQRDKYENVFFILWIIKKKSFLFKKWFLAIYVIIWYKTNILAWIFTFLRIKYFFIYMQHNLKKKIIISILFTYKKSKKPYFLVFFQNHLKKNFVASFPRLFLFYVI